MTAADLVPLLKRHPVSVASVVVILACVGFAYYRGDVIALSQTEYEAKSAEANQMASNVKGAPGLAEQVTEIQGLAKELESRLVRVNQLAVNLQYFYKLEADHGVKLLDVRQLVQPARRGPKTTIYDRVPFSLTVQGSYPQLVKFLAELENGRHLCRINTASFSRPVAAGDGLSAPDVTLTLNLELLGQS